MLLLLHYFLVLLHTSRVETRVEFTRAFLKPTVSKKCSWETSVGLRAIYGRFSAPQIHLTEVICTKIDIIVTVKVEWKRIFQSVLSEMVDWLIDKNFTEEIYSIENNSRIYLSSKEYLILSTRALSLTFYRYEPLKWSTNLYMITLDFGACSKI